MGEIVVAYARPDEDAAELVMGKLKALGFSVKGTEIAPPPFTRTTARRAAANTGPQVVLWSKHYAAAYAKGAASARSPIIARLDTAPVSARLKTDAVDLRAWRGRDDHRGWRALLADVRSVAAPAKGKAAAKAAPAKAASAKVEKKSGGAVGLVLLALAALAAAGGGAAYYLGLIP